MLSLLIRICGLFAALTFAVAASAAPDRESFVAALDRFVSSQLIEQRVPGAAIAVLHEGEVVVAKGFGLANLEHKVPVTAETVFQSGSLGKMFTSAIVLKQVEMGRIGLDDSVAKYLTDAPTAWRPITIRQLLSHTSGVANHGPEFDYRRDYSEEELLNSIYAQPLDFSPGTRWSYSNSAYILLGFIVKKAIGKSYLDLLRTDVFEPLGMTTARGISDSDIVLHRAAGYQAVKGELRNHDYVSPTMNATADGSLYFSLKDMIAWSRGVDGLKVLSPESWRLTHTPVRLASGRTYPYGLGWVVDEAAGKPRLHHGGSWQGFKTYYSRYLADGLAVIVLTNSGDTNVEKLADGIAELWNPVLVAKGPVPAAEPAVEKRGAAMLERARTGSFKSEDLALVRKDAAGLANQYFPSLMKEYGPLKTLTLTRRRELGDDVLYTYRADFAGRSATVTYGEAPEGRVSSFRIVE